MNLVGPEPLSAPELERDLARCAGLLRRAPPGEVALATRSDACFVRVALACARAGRVLLPLDALAPPAEVAPLLSRVGLALLDEAPYETWALPSGAERARIAPEARPSAWQRLLGRAAPLRSFPACLEQEAPDHTPQAGAGLLLRTSGTTGAARLVSWTPEALQAQHQTLSAALQVGPSSRVMNLLPMHHIDGLVMGLFLVAGQAATLVRVGPRVVEDLPAVLDAVWRERVTHLIATPTLLALLLRSGEDLRELFDTAHFQMFVSTAAPLPDPIWRRMEQASGRPVVNVYGLTETGNLFFAGPEPETRRVGTVGRARDCELRIVDPSGAPVPPGHRGELHLRGPSVMRSYADGSSPLREGWYATGDLVEQDPDGLLRVVGRSRSMISVGGLKVEPLEVERALLEHPAVRDARVMGEPDPLWGERVVAELVAEGVDEAALTQHLRARLSEHKLPRELRFLGRLRRGDTGKPLPTALSTADRVLAVAARVLRADPERLSLSARPGDLPGWDSMGHLDLIDALEKEFEAKLQGRDLLRLRSLADAVQILEQALAR